MSIAELEAFFQSKQLPTEVQLNRSTKIVDMELYLKTSFAQAKADGEKSPAYGRLMQLYNFLISEGNYTEL